MFSLITLKIKRSLQLFFPGLCMIVGLMHNISAQTSACFEDKRQKGIEEANKKRYNSAISLFFAALTACDEQPKPDEVKDVINRIEAAQKAIEKEITASRDEAVAAEQKTQQALKIAEQAREEEAKARIEAVKNGLIAREKGIQAEMLRLAMLADNQRISDNYTDALLLAYLSIKLAGERTTPAMMRSFAQAVWDTLKQPIANSNFSLQAIYPLANGKEFLGIQEDEQLVFLREGRVEPFNAEAGPFAAKAVASSSDKLLAGNSSGEVWLWNNGTKALNQFKAHSESILATSAAHNGKYWLTTSRDNSARLWTAEGALVQTLAGHTGNVYSAIFSPDDQLILTRSSDHRLGLWSATNGDHILLPNSPLYSYDAIFSASGQRILAAGHDGKLYRWDIQGKALAALALHQGPIRQLQHSPNHHYIYTKGVDSTLALLSPEGELIQQFGDHLNPITITGADPQGAHLAWGLKNHEIHLFNLSSHEIQVLRGHQAEIIGLEFSGDGNHILSTSRDGMIRLWDIKGNLVLEVNLAVNKTPIAASFSTDGRKIVAFSNENRTILECPTPADALSNLVKQEHTMRPKIEQIKSSYSILFVE